MNFGSILVGKIKGDGAKLVNTVKDDVVDPVKRTVEHLDLCKQHKKLVNYYDEISEKPINSVRLSNAYLARHKASGDYRCVRIIPKTLLPKDFFATEVEIFKSLFHPNLNNLYETMEDKKYYYFITDRLDRPNLYQAIPKLFPDNKDFDEAHVASVVRILLKALGYMHKRGVVHGDLSYESILVDPKQGLDSLFIAGVSRVNRKDRFYRHEQPSGTTDDGSSDSEGEHDQKTATTEPVKVAREDLFAAPETRWGDLSIYDEPACDIWSLGVITYQLLARRHPFEDPNVRPKNFENEAWKRDHFFNSPYLLTICPEAKEFVSELMTYKHADRPTADQAFEHEWLRIADNMDRRTQKEAVVDSLTNLQSFDARTKLEQSARLYICTNLLQDSQREALNACFRYLDRDQDSVITRNDLKIALEKIHGKDKSEKIESMLQDTFDRVDVKKTGAIGYSEFLAAAADDQVLLTKKNLRATFDAFDKSKTGTITMDDLNEIFSESIKRKSVTKRGVKKIMQEVDVDGDGDISFDEFCSIMRVK